MIAYLNLTGIAIQQSQMKIFLCINAHIWTAGLNQSSKIVSSRLGKETKNEGHIQGALLVIWCWFQAVYLDTVVVSICGSVILKMILATWESKQPQGFQLPILPHHHFQCSYPPCFTATHFPCSWLLSICLQGRSEDADETEGETNPKAAGETPFLKGRFPCTVSLTCLCTQGTGWMPKWKEVALWNRVKY